VGYRRKEFLFAMSEDNLKRTPRELHLRRKKMWDASISNHVRYVDSATGQFGAEFVEERACPSCGGDSSRHLFDKSGGSYSRCEECRMVFLNPAFRDEELVKYYRGNHTVQGETVEDDLPFYAGLYRAGLSRVEALIPERGRLLDYGCSTGVFLGIATENGWDCEGIELNVDEARIARERGFLIQESVIGDATVGEAFDVITLWDVFEHIKDGVAFLEECRRFLRPGGMVFVQTPNSDSLAARTLQVACNVFDGLEHVNLYARQSLSMVCDRAGYAVEDFGTVIPEVGVINNYLSFEDPYLGGATDTESVLGLISRADIMSRDLGYKFQACLRMRS
jgi:2-polyprenyl-3-methyl-5-hydroxy-6-metoxy-1,4-benzoquinol methylase